MVQHVFQFSHLSNISKVFECLSLAFKNIVFKFANKRNTLKPLLNYHKYISERNYLTKCKSFQCLPFLSTQISEIAGPAQDLTWDKFSRDSPAKAQGDCCYFFLQQVQRWQMFRRKPLISNSKMGFYV